MASAAVENESPEPRAQLAFLQLQAVDELHAQVIVAKIMYGPRIHHTFFQVRQKGEGPSYARTSQLDQTC